MGGDDGEVSKLPRGNPRLGQPLDAIPSLNEAWFHTLDRCVSDSSRDVILPFMRNCFSGGAMHAVLLLQKCHGDQLASDITGFIMEEPQS